MAGRSMSLDVLVRLRDHLSGPLRMLKNNLSQIANFARRIGVLGVAISAISFMGPIREAAAFQQQLLDIAGTAELTGNAAFQFVAQTQRQYEDLGLAIGQASQTIAEGAGQMIAAGLDTSLIDATIGDIGRAATAANASFADMAGVGTSMLQNLKLPADEMRDSLGALVVAGKLGAFELKDMAATFPNLTSGVAKFGVRGREAVNFLASALQIARKGTADPAQAANNLANFLDKALSPLTKKNFEKAGVNIEAVMMDAATKGLNPIEAVIQKIGKLTGVNETAIAGYMKKAKANGLEGAEALGFVRQQLEAIGAAGAIGELFQDKQVLDFLVPFLANIDEYKSIKAQVAAATSAAIDGDFETQMAGLNRQLAILSEIGTQSVRMVGLAFGEWLPQINEGLMSALAFVRDLDQSTGGMVKTGLRFAGAGLLMVSALGALGIALPIVGAGLAAIGALAALIVSPIGLLVAALGAGGAYVWRGWDRFGPRLMRLWDRARRGFADMASTVVDRGRRMVTAGRELVSAYGPMIQQQFARLRDFAVSAFGVISSRLPSFDAVRSESLALLADVLERLVAIGDGARTFFAGFAKGFGEAFAGRDFSQAGIAAGALDLLAAALDGLQAVGSIQLDALKGVFGAIESFAGGVGKHLSGIGEGLGGNLAELVKLGSTLGGIFADLGSMLKLPSLGDGKFLDAVMGAFGQMGQNIGAGIETWLSYSRMALEAINGFVEGIKELTGFMASGQPIPWDNILPKGVVAAFQAVVAAIQTVKAALTEFRDWLSGFSLPSINLNPFSTDGRSAAPGEALPNGGTMGAPDDRDPALDDFLNGPPKPRAALDGRSRFAAAQPPVRQEVVVGGSVRIAVQGPGTVVAASSDNKNVPVGNGNGRMVGRV